MYTILSKVVVLLALAVIDCSAFYTRFLFVRFSVIVGAYNYNAAPDALYMSKDVLIILFLANAFFYCRRRRRLLLLFHRLRLNLLLSASQ